MCATAVALFFFSCSLSRLVLHCDYFGINVNFIYTCVDGAAAAAAASSIDNNLSDQVVEFVNSFFRVEPIRSVRFLFRLI